MGIHHLVCKIENLLELNDYELEEMFGQSKSTGEEIRRELEIRTSYGDIYIGTDNCEGFNPITGCPGHEPKDSAEDLPLTALIIIKELSRKKSELALNGVVGMARKEAYQDAINIVREMYKRELEVANG